MSNNKYWLAKDILEIFKGYTEVKLSDGIRNVINNSELTNSGIEDFVKYDDVRILGWKQLKEYNKTHIIDDNCSRIKISRKYNKSIRYMQKGDILCPVIPSKDMDILYISEESEEKCIYNDSIICIRPAKPEIDNKYISIMLQSILQKEGNITSTKRLTIEMLSNIKIAKLSAVEMQKIVDEYTKIQEETKKFISTLNKLNNF